MAITDSNGKPINGGRGRPPNPAEIAERAANSRSRVDPAASIEAFAGSENIKGLASGAKQRVEDFVQSTGFGKALRSFGLLPDAEPENFEFVSATSGDANPDWRVKLSLPKNFEGGSMLGPLFETDGLVWPYTPQVYITHSANYSQIQPVHSNYPFLHIKILKWMHLVS